MVFTFVLSQSDFIRFHIFVLSSGLPVFVTKILPLDIFCSAAYFFSILQSSFGMMITRSLPFIFTGRNAEYVKEVKAMDKEYINYISNIFHNFSIIFFKPSCILHRYVI